VVDALGMINEVTLRRARLVLGWVTVCGRMNQLGICNQPPRSTQPGHPSMGMRRCAVSTSESWGVNGHTARYTSPVSVVSQCKLVSG